MPNSCCAPGCKSGYRSANADEIKPALFKFPKDNDLFQKWVKAIPRKDWMPNQSSHICAKHFSPEDFCVVSNDSRNDRRNSRATQALQRSRLKTGAIPHIFLNLPSYLSSDRPASRSSKATSSARLERENARTESLNMDFLEKQDAITDFAMLKEKVKHEVLPAGFVLIVNEETVKFHYITTEWNNAEVAPPKLLASTVIANNLKLHCFVNGASLPPMALNDFAPTGYVTKMSSILNILALQKSMVIETGNSDLKSSLNMALLYLSQFIDQPEQEDFDPSFLQLVSFITEQLQLGQRAKHARRYSVNTIKTAFLWQLTSTSLYKKLHSFFALPSLRWLQNLSSGATVSSGVVNLNYLHARSKALSGNEKMVTLMIDEVYIAERVEYSNGNFIGITENGTPAKTVLAFMIQSLYCNYKDIVCLIPIAKLDTDTLHSWFMKVMVALKELFHVVAVSTDNHVCNRKLFMDMCGGQLQPSILHPTRPNDRLFLLFDFTHNFKNIFNNFLGKERFHLPALDFPDLLGHSCIAHFGHLRRLYALEECKVLKIAFTLKKVSLNPSNIARTSPQHALSVFSESTARGLKYYSEQNPAFSETAVFVEFISNLWKVMSLKTPSKGICKKDEYCKPLSVKETYSLNFLIQAKDVFIKWRESGNTGLTKETFLACIQSMEAMIELVSYLHNKHNFRYTLPGKFMSDPIEARFGWYRQASGGNFFMSVRQLMLVEKKIRMLSLLQQKMLVEASKFSFEKIQFELSTASNVPCFEWLYQFLLQNQVEDINEMSLVDANVTYFVSGYIGRSISRRRKCEGCKGLLLADKDPELSLDDHLPEEYKHLFADANRGGLSAPTELCFASTALAVQSYTAVSSDEAVKKRLLTASDHRVVFVQAVSRLASEWAAPLKQRCPKDHSNFEMILETAFNCFSKNELKRLNSKSSEAPAKMKRTARKLTNKASAKHN